MKSTVVLLLVCLAIALAQQFEADVSIYNSPNIRGTMTGVIDYSFPQTSQSIRYTGGPQELILYSNTTRLKYLLCTGVCEAQTWQEPQLKFFSESGDTNIASITRGSRTCSGVQKTSGTVLNIYTDSTGPCRAVLRDGTTYDFDTLRAVDATQFTAFQNKGCPVQQCGKLIDFVFVLDESGSITSSSFTYMKDFITNVAGSYSYGPLGAAVGIVMFASAARVVININADQNSVMNAINSIQQLSGNTCIGCGIQSGYNMYVNYGRTGSPQKVMMVMTDGQNNRNTATFLSTVSTAKAYGILIFAIGVGNGVDRNEITNIGSNLNGVQTVFFSPSYADLNNIVNALIIVTCVDIPGNPCGAGCLGFCSCNKQCLCPSTCNDNNPCTVDNCDPAVNGAGCTWGSRVCDDLNACTDDSCNPALPDGCTTSPKDCSTTDKCQDVSCSTTVGCQYTRKTCNDNNVCTSDSCTSTIGCQNVNISCDRCKNPTVVVCKYVNCSSTECNPADGQCLPVPRDCNDNNPCSDDSCDVLQDKCVNPPTNCDDGNFCTVDFCSQINNATAGIKIGCNNIFVNETIYCDDHSACTTDICINSTGCINPSIVCNDSLICTTDTCNSILGCQFPSRDCTNDPSIPTLTGNCYVAACSESQGCFVQEFPGRTIDKCGVCDGNGKSCIALNTAQAAGIAAGVLAGIIIAAIAVCAILGAIGGKKGYDIYMRNKNNMTGANTNPLYTDNGLSGTNPMYTDQNL